MDQSALDKSNSEFWDELCGTTLAKSLGLKDHAEESLRRFDRAYLQMYPYLLEHVQPSQMRGKSVLEVGLGYGTLSQQIIEAGAHYVGLDIATGPLKMVKHRMARISAPGVSLQGSMLNCPVATETMDFVVSIGCFHHTGSVEQCLAETFRVLRKGGTAVLMVYNQYSYRQWLRWPLKTLAAWWAESHQRSSSEASNQSQRRAYDENTRGAGAPETTFITAQRLRHLLRQFSSVSINKENNSNVTFGRIELISRPAMLSTLGKWAGLDLYVVARK